MRKQNERHIGFRVDAELLAKFRYVCDYEGRSATAQLIRLMQKFIAQYEKEFGEIKLEESENK
ncbi:MAG: hypothetical protein J6K73_00305 [Clostridia bacterium]|nr:hypothetical protein [Clostridia bacterium]